MAWDKIGHPLKFWLSFFSHCRRDPLILTLHFMPSQQESSPTHNALACWKRRVKPGEKFNIGFFTQSFALMPYQAFSHPQQGRIDLTLSILPCPQGWICWSIPVDELMMRRMSVLHQNEGGIGKSIPYAREISRDLRDFPRAQGKSRGSREISRAKGMDFPIPTEFWWSTDILLIINPSTGMDQEIHPCVQGRIDSVKINPSLPRIREWALF